MTIGIRLALALGVLLTACGPRPGPVPIVVPEGSCEAAAARLEDLRCVAEGVELWVGFADACRVASEDGERWFPECLAKLDDCARVDAVWLDGCGP